MTKLGSDIARSPARLVDAGKAKRGRRQFLSGGLDRLRDILAFSPFRQQGAAAPRVALPGRLDAADPFTPEMAETPPPTPPPHPHPTGTAETEARPPDGRPA